MKVVAFKAFYHRRIVMQVVIGGSGRDFVAYIGVLMDERVSHSPYEPIEAGGQGLEIPEGTRMTYSDAKANFGYVIEKLEEQGMYWRN